MTDDRPHLTAAQTDRAAGVLLALACGDALGAGYEFKPPRIHGEPVAMVGGGAFGWKPGEWTDDTSMAIAIAQEAATGIDLNANCALDAITVRFVNWAGQANDIGIQTRRVLSGVADHPTAAAATTYAAKVFAETDGEGTGGEGNGSLMRTAPIALAYLHDPAARTRAAHAIGALTHGGPEAAEACALWCHAIAHGVLYGNFDGLRIAVAQLPTDRAALWTTRLNHAESVPPHELGRNGYVVTALQAAWSAITRTPVPADDPAVGVFAAGHLRDALEAAVRAGNDTDTVAAIAGGLLGARWGVSAVPLDWARRVHGWPGLHARDLIHLSLLTANAGQSDSRGWPTAAVQDYSDYGDTGVLAAHPHDPGVLLAGVGALRNLPDGVDAVVSLCRLGADEVPAPGVAAGDHIEVWLADSGNPKKNAHLDHVLVQAADTVAALRGEGRTVLLHCVQAHSRTPTVAALYSTRHREVSTRIAMADITEVLPDAEPNPGFLASLDRLDPS